MKKSSILFASAMVLLGIVQIGFASNKTKGHAEDGPITVLYSPGLYKLTNDWTTEYVKSKPGEQFRIIRAEDNNLSQPGVESNQIGFYSSEYLNGLHTRPAWEMSVGREVFVFVMNSENPMVEQVDKVGISNARLSEFLNTSTNQNWLTLLGTGQKIPVQFYIPENDPAAKKLSVYAKSNLNESNIKFAANMQELIANVKADKNAMGFCRLTDIINPQDNSFMQGIALMPIDKNGNGKIDPYENIYTDLNSFSRGVWIGKYPQELISNIFMASSAKPVNESELTFLKWVLTDGQIILSNNGYSNLAMGESNSKLEKLLGDQLVILQPEDNYAGWKVAIMVIILSIVVALLIETIILVLRGNKRDSTGTSDSQRIFDENALESPGGLFFDKTHTWAFMENNGSVKIGVDDFLAHLTGQLTRVKLKKPGDKIKKNEALLSIIQNGKQLTIKSPVTGVIIEENLSLKGNPSLINTSPYGDGWVYLVKPENWLREIQFLFMADKFKIWLKAEFNRLKDFIAVVRQTGDESYIPLVLQEGGEIKEGVLMNFGPEVWEDFQADFIDKTA